MAHEVELEKMRSQLMMANARVSELETKERAVASATATPVTAKKHNPALDPPRRMSFLQMTPKQIYQKSLAGVYQKVWDSPEEQEVQGTTPATAVVSTRHKFTPKEMPILEDATCNTNHVCFSLWHSGVCFI